MSAQPHPAGPAKEVIAPPHVSLRKEVGRPAGPPPLEYGEVRLWLVAKDAAALFAYWEFRPEEHPEAAPAGGAARFFLRILREGGAIIESTAEIEPAAGQCTAAAEQADTLYHAELGFFNEQGVWCFLARSGPARTPPAETPGSPSAPQKSPANPAREPSSEKTHSWSTADEARFKDILAAEVSPPPENKSAPKASKPPEPD